VLRCSTGLPLTNGSNRENMIFTYAAPPPEDGAGGNFPSNRWPQFTYGGEPTASGFSKDFLECGLELDAMGRLDTPVRRQLMAVELSHPDALRQAEEEQWGREQRVAHVL
jgi:hypothetical protein